MTEYEFPALPVAVAYLDEIAQEMVALFGIPLTEAVGRINRHWRRSQITSEPQLAVLIHEDPDAWAKNIYYGRNQCWWLSEEGLEPLPYP